jgi:hypothetical protein
MLGRYWGYIFLVVVLIAWAGLGAYVPAFVLLVLCVLSGIYFLFKVPLWCGAENRNRTFCRNNSNGLLLGCYLREHKYQRLKMTFVPRMLRATWRRRANMREAMALVGTLTATILGVVQVVRLL